jgi:hypothetical protein
MRPRGRTAHSSIARRWPESLHGQRDGVEYQRADETGALPSAVALVCAGTGQGGMTDLFDYEPPVRYPDAPGHQDTDTSRDAAESIEGVAGRIRQMVHRAIDAAGERGLTTNECADLLGIDKGTVQPRTSELRLLGKIYDGGARRRNASGRTAIVWVARAPDQLKEVAQ